MSDQRGDLYPVAQAAPDPVAEIGSESERLNDWITRLIRIGARMDDQESCVIVADDPTGANPECTTHGGEYPCPHDEFRALSREILAYWRARAAHGPETEL